MDPLALGEHDNAARPDDGVGLTTIELPFDIVRRDNGARALATGSSMPAVDSSTSALVKAVARGYGWRQQLLNGSAQSINEIAQREGITRRYVARLLRPGFLAPDIVAAILANRQSAHLTVDRLRGPIPFDWSEQRQLFGFDRAKPEQGGRLARREVAKVKIARDVLPRADSEAALRPVSRGRRSAGNSLRRRALAAAG
jgi:hypothetical protein